MEVLLQKYPPPANIDEGADKRFDMISNGQELWVTELSPEIASFINARK